MNVININDSRKNIRKVKVGERTTIWDFVNLYECEIGDDSMIGAFVEIQAGAVIGRRSRIQSHTFICAGVTIEDDVFVGHGVMFINDNHPRANGDWVRRPVRVCQGASIGSGAIILGGITIGREAMVGAGAVVTRDVESGVTVVGNPARPLQESQEL